MQPFWESQLLSVLGGNSMYFSLPYTDHEVG